MRRLFPLFAFVVATACIDTTAPAKPNASVAIRADVAALPQLEALKLSVTAPDMDPVLQSFPRSGDSVSGVVTVKAGSSRVFSVAAIDSAGDTTHTGADTVNVRYGINPNLTLKLRPKSGQVPIVIVIDQPKDSTPVDTQPTPPPPSDTVGPAKRLNPTAGVVILPGQSIQAAVNANPGRTTFWLKAGLYSQQSVIPKTGNTFLADSGAIMDGGNVVSQAFSGTADSVTIRNLTVQHYNTPLKAGAIQGDWNQSVYWVVQNCDIGFNHAAGLYTTDYMLASNNAIHDNGQIGILGKANFATFTGNEVYGNNTGGNDPNDEAGAMKILQSSGVRFAGNWVHNNHGQGIWFDGSNQNALIENNLVTNNENAGIFYEISYGAIIRNNVVTGNGGTHSIANGAILVSASSNVEVYGNTVSGNNTGIVALQANRGSGVLGTYLVTNLWVHNNTSTLTTQCSGIIDQIGDKAVFSTTRNNRFDSNTYSLGSLATPFCGPSGAMTKAQWQAAGYDVHSTFK